MATSSGSSAEASVPYLSNSDFGGLLHLVAAASALTKLDGNKLQSHANEKPTADEGGEKQGAEAPSSDCETGRGGNAQPRENSEHREQSETKRVVSDDESSSDFEKSLASPPASPGGASSRRSVKKHRRSQRSASSEAAPQSSSASVCDASVSMVSTVSESSSESSATVATIMNKPFPQRLMNILSEKSLADIITWLPHGRAFVVLQPNVFAEKVLPVYIPDQQSVVPAIGGVVPHASATPPKYPSFTRKLNRWGFRQICRGPDAGAFHHPLFRRDEPELCHSMECQKSRRSRSSISHKTELVSPKRVEGPVCSVDVAASTSNNDNKVDGPSPKKRSNQACEEPTPLEGSPAPLLPAASSTAKPLPPKKRRMVSLDTLGESSNEQVQVEMTESVAPSSQAEHEQKDSDEAASTTPTATTQSAVQHAPNTSAPVGLGVPVTQQVTLMPSSFTAGGTVVGPPGFSLTNARVAIPAPTAAPVPTVASVSAPAVSTPIVAGAPAGPSVSSAPISIAPAQAPGPATLPQHLLTVLEQSRLAAQMFYNQQPLPTVAVSSVSVPSPAPGGLVLNEVPTVWPVPKQPQPIGQSEKSFRMSVLSVGSTTGTQQPSEEAKSSLSGDFPPTDSPSNPTPVTTSTLSTAQVTAPKMSEAMNSSLPHTLVSSSTPSIKDALAQLRAEHAKSMLRRAFEDARAKA